MCGIVGYIGTRSAAPVLLEALKRLEYRGYDSAGVATSRGGSLSIRKCPGKIASLEQLLKQHMLDGTIGIAHTRWATHGEPSERNAHPQCSRGGGVAVVHNGIIENHEALRTQLKAEGFAFVSDTDSEVLPHLIDREFRRGAGSLENAVTKALVHVEGAYALAVVSSHSASELVAACNSSPLVIGIGTNELFLASDESAIVEHVHSVLHLKDGELIVLRRNGSYTFKGISLEDAQSRIEKPAVRLEDIQKGGHAHFMHKEIHEQEQSMRNTLATHVKPGMPISFGGLSGDIENRLRDVRKVCLVGCGTSLFSAMVGKPLFEGIAGVMCEVEQAAEFSYRDLLLTSQDVVVGISQSGETADTLRALAAAREHHALCMSITNRVGSTLAKRTRLGMYLHAGPEVAVASTKAFTSQAAMLALFAVRLAQLRGRPVQSSLLEGINRLPELLAAQLLAEPEMAVYAARFIKAARMIVIGRGFALPLALETALKIREVAYIDAHGLSAAELKHGTLALVEPGTPVVAILPHGALRAKMLSTIEEVKARGADVLVIKAPEDVPNELISIVLAPALQLLAYHLGIARGVDVDQPRNLAKSVTVE